MRVLLSCIVLCFPCSHDKTLEEFWAEAKGLYFSTYDSRGKYCCDLKQRNSMHRCAASLTFSSLTSMPYPSFDCASLMGMIVRELVSPMFSSPRALSKTKEARTADYFSVCERVHKTKQKIIALSCTLIPKSLSRDVRPYAPMRAGTISMQLQASFQ